MIIKMSIIFNRKLCFVNSNVCVDKIAATTNLKVNKKKAGEQKMCTFWDEVMEYGKMEAQYEDIRKIMESLNMSMEQAMDVLKIPESERAKYTSKA